MLNIYQWIEEEFADSQGNLWDYYYINPTEQIVVDMLPSAYNHVNNGWILLECLFNLDEQWNIPKPPSSQHYGSYDAIAYYHGQQYELGYTPQGIDHH